ncbi:ABC transporter substrate-binding protein [Corynebacterium pyruviciproducens]|uniref:ABC transporter substrate-binding protein n=1 Tax=Corynebacterium pyruviciproducens TaxID=598660 RepID=A0AAF1BWK3_9CORY|nr:ABC transporter substrate-binding protein [Corynebacterium pyruviciproducens]WOT02527.1 ABC transporter substrate-binding protein [Corynebacterium pyruviciproducens]
MKKLSKVGLAVVMSAALALSGCGESAVDKQQQTSTTAAEATQAADGATKVDSCEETLTFEKAPENVLMLSEVDVSILYDLGVLDHVTHKAGVQRVKDIDSDMEKAIAEIPTVEAGEQASGGAQMSTEQILDINPDLVIAFDTGVDRNALRQAGIPVYAPDTFCTEKEQGPATWDNVKNEITKVANIFHVQEKGKELIKKVEGELPTPAADTSLNAVALYVTPGSTEMYTYGNTSMFDPILTANGLNNMYTDNSTRVFDASVEDLLGKNPDVIVFTSEDGDEQDARETFEALPSAKDLKAVQENKVYYVPFALTDPATTLSVKGATTLAKQLQG